MPKIYTIKQVAKIFQVSDELALRLVRGEQIKAFKVGREWRVTEAALESYLETMHASSSRGAIGGR